MEIAEADCFRVYPGCLVEREDESERGGGEGKKREGEGSEGERRRRQGKQLVSRLQQGQGECSSEKRSRVKGRR